MEALAHVERRRVLVALLRGNSDDDALGGSSEGRTVDKVADGGTDEMGLSTVDMQHNHLPKLEDFEFVSWDRENHAVTEGSRFGEIEPLLELLDENEDELPDDWL